MKHNTLGDGGSGFNVKALDSLAGGVSLGTLHEQRFFAMRASGGEVRFPFPAGPFTVLVDMTAPVDDVMLRSYAEALVDHGCVQAACRGEEADRMVDIFNSLAETLSERDDRGADDVPFTAMCMDDEPLNEAIAYFVLPCGLAPVGLVMVIGGQDEFRNAVNGFSDAAGAASEDIGEAVFTEEDLVCFVSPVTPL